MRKFFLKTVITAISLIFSPLYLIGEVPDTVWSLQACIKYALEKNISIQKSVWNNQSNQINLQQIKANRFPSLNASVNQNFNWAREIADNQEYGSYSVSSGSSYALNMGLTLYNGFRNQKSIRQSELSYRAGQYDIEAIKESISLNILDAYLQILYAEEQVKNNQKQIEATENQLKMAEERFKLGVISKSDYLQVKSEYASEKLSLTNSQSLLTLNKLTLMQLMELPVSSDFSIEYPDLSDIVLQLHIPEIDSVYNEALSIKPQIKSKEISLQIANLGVSIAKSSYQPKLSLSSGISTGYTSGSVLDYDYQVKNKISPFLGLSLSVPIYQNGQARSEVAQAKINTKIAELNEIDIKNQLRKEVEQVYTDLLSAVNKYEASFEQYNSLEEAYNVALEKYNQGLINSVDFLIQKTNFIQAESELLQAKYNLVFSYKILDFYLGKPLIF